MNKDIQAELLDLKRRDDDTRTRLVASGLLYQGYNKGMEAVHLQNAERLETIINQFGWPGISLVGEEGAEAAFTIAHHAISKPAFQRKCLALIALLSAPGMRPHATKLFFWTASASMNDSHKYTAPFSTGMRMER